MPRRKTKPTQRPEISRLELDVMDIVWTLGECSSAEVIAEFVKKRPLAETTIRTVLTNLRKKDYLEQVPTIERGYRLRATVSRSSVARRWLKHLTTSLFGGSPREAISFLLADEQLNDEDLAEIRRMIDADPRSKRP